jgi:ABC-type branched-subunit amino acid transport system ATPase component
VIEHALVVESVEFSYGRLQILFGVSLQVARGESLALVGTNGAGKSTLLKIVAGLETPNAGRVWLNGSDITEVPAERLASRGLVLVQGGNAVFPDLTVAENLDVQALTARRAGNGLRARRDAMLATFPALASALNRQAGTLSGGQQQQLALAKTMLLEPSVVCIDELSLGLAPVIVEALIEVVRSIRDSGSAVILVEQSLNVAAALCERAIFLEKGAVKFEGPVRDLLDRDDLARAVFLGQRAKSAPRQRRARSAAP